MKRKRSEADSGGEKKVEFALIPLWSGTHSRMAKKVFEGGENWALISGRGLPVRALVIFEFLRREYCSRQEADAGETTGN